MPTDPQHASPRSIIRRLGWPKWVGLALTMLFILELFLVCGNASLFNVVMAFVPDIIRPANPDSPPNSINDLAFSPDGTKLASATSDGKLRLWQVTNGGLQATIDISTRPLSSISFSSDGALLAAGSWDGSVHIWHVNDMTLVRTLAHDSPVRSIAFSPDGKNLATGIWDGSVHVWSLQAEVPPHELGAHTDWISRVTYSPDGQMLASASNDGTLQIWNPADGSVQQTLTTHPNAILNIAFSLDSQSMIASVFEQGLQIWQVSNSEPLAVIAQPNPVWSLAISPSGAWLATGTNGGWRLWQADDGDQPWRVQPTPYFEQPNQSALLSMAFSPDDTLLAIGSRDGRVMLMDISGEGVNLVTEWVIE